MNKPIKKIIALNVISKKKKKIKTPKVSGFQENISFFIICYRCGSNNDTIFKEKASIKKLKIIGLINNINE